MAIRTLVATLALAALSAPVLANNVIHFVDNEMGFKSFPDHAPPSTITRAQVLEELRLAQMDPSWALSQGDMTPPIKFTPSLTRAEVQADLARAMKHPSWTTRNSGMSGTVK